MGRSNGSPTAFLGKGIGGIRKSPCGRLPGQFRLAGSTGNTDGSRVKLRLFKDSIRFRVRRPDVEELLSKGQIEHGVRIGPGQADLLTYRLRTVADGDHSVTRLGLGLEVRILETAARNWAESSAVGIGFTTPWGSRVLVEKDFPCLEPRPGEGNEGAFPRPAEVPPTCSADS